MGGGCLGLLELAPFFPESLASLLLQGMGDER